MAELCCRKCNKPIHGGHIPYCSKCEEEILIEEAARKKKITIAFTIFIIIVGLFLHSKFF